MKTASKSAAKTARHRNPEIYLHSSNRVFHESTQITATEYSDELSRDSASPRSIALQIYLPFCPIRCLNCQKHVTITHDSAEIDRYLDSLEREVALVVDKIGNSQPLSQLSVGGGSPNYLSDLQLVRLISMLERAFKLDTSTEMSIEANARHTSATQLKLLHGLGFTRISFSIGDLDPMVQLAIGRSQSLDMLREVFDTARESGFDTISTDLMYGLPNQTTGSMRRTVRSMTSLAPDRISCGVYNRRADIFPHQHAIAGTQMPSVADKLALLNVIVDGLTGDEYAWVGLDCFMRHEDFLCRAQRAHKLKRNWLGYTVSETDSVLGFGTNAVSEIGRLYVQNHVDLPAWSQSLSTGLLPIRGGIRLTPADRRYRDVLTDLMCNLESEDCSPLLELEEETGRLDEFQNRGLVEVMGKRIAITPQGRYMLPQIWNETMPNHYRWSHPL